MRHRALALWLAAAMVMVMVSAADAGAVTKSRLKAFSSCKDLVSFARAGAVRTDGGVGVTGRAIASPPDVITSPPLMPAPAPGTVAPESAPAAAPTDTTGDAATPDYSGTNVQEAGVDEPDIVKTDGKRIFAVTDGQLRIIDVTGATPQLVGSLSLEGTNHRLLLRGNRVLVIAANGVSPIFGGPVPTEAPGNAGTPIAPVPIYGGPTKTIVTEVDVSDPASPKVARTMTIDGRFVDARQNGGTARLVVEASPSLIVPQNGGDVDAAIKRAGVSKFLGRTVLHSNISGHTFRRTLAPCDTVRRPRQFSGLDVVAILTVDLDRGMYSLDRDGVMAGAQVVYGSADSLYVASRSYSRAVELGTGVPSSPTTEIHRFDISDPDHTVYAASGTVPGFILNSYAMSEYKGDLRVASTEQPPWQPDGAGSASHSTVTVLRQDGTKLAPVGSVTGLGENQRIYAVRFLGDKAFVVTFRQVDPLYALDLSDPTAPALRGALELPGYSSYLHPITDDLLLGIGREGQDAEASLFDVSDLAAPKRVSQLDFGPGYSAVENEPHAFLYWPASKLAVLPLTTYGTATFSGAVGLRAAAGQPLSEVGRISQYDGQRKYDAGIERSLVAGGRLYTLSYLGLQSSSLDSLAPIGFMAFS
jgi:uncharacterized secreted protein with C-terminal beta-propeller domain